MEAVVTKSAEALGRSGIPQKKTKYRVLKHDAFNAIAHETKAQKDESICKLDWRRRRYPLIYSIGVSFVPMANQLVATGYWPPV